ncbi:MAG: dihydropteroate synthase [Proteobacteria bacterium]|jgi:dihydropteroate synthase|nr:dihydropteroate synthase [Desulfocapsa sp.]MBU3945285.1 dihydropteroate synthase [Pseudomonadota bacterium]MBU3982199.1 dihydropteroate synthase [Pseudomonadota bacterium]MBU4028625.1 dihydropteroate synthase [Pseudomonadota bacterium]MBU4044355.1 dihydropteroate synthase [Pseudomonadota bacterium]
MGIINVTPDSFSDGGWYQDEVSIVAQADALVAAGADLLDVGGESTRPFAQPVSEIEELRRVIPAIQAIRRKYSLPISIDTRKAEVARQALMAGVNMINDISALRHDPAMIELLRTTEVPVVIMHMQGTPGDMQVDPVYQDVVAEILDFFRERLDWLQGQGVDRRRIILDPGIGFGKTLIHNLLILKNLSAFSSLGQPILLGHSRKRFLGEITDRQVEERDFATAVVSALAVTKGISIVRVHDVSSSRQAIQIAEAIDAV